MYISTSEMSCDISTFSRNKQTFMVQTFDITAHDHGEHWSHITMQPRRKRDDWDSDEWQRLVHKQNWFVSM